MVDYDDLAFKPKLTWEELKEIASFYKGFQDKGSHFIIMNCCFWKSGGISVLTNMGGREQSIPFVFELISYEQMEAILKNLFDKKEGTMSSAENQNQGFVNKWVLERNQLESEIKHLKDLQANQDREVENLRDLLEECIVILGYASVISMSSENKEIIKRTFEKIRTTVGKRRED